VPGRPTTLGPGRGAALVNSPLPSPLARPNAADALHGRNPNHNMDNTALWINGLLRSKLYTAGLGFFILLDLALGILERPASTRETPAAIIPFWATGLVEVACLAVFTADVALRNRYLTKRQFWRSRWTLAKLAFVVLAIANTALYMTFGDGIPRLHRFARPVMVAAQFRNVSKIFGSMLVSIPRVANVTVLLVFHVVFFGVITHVLFGGIDCAVNERDEWSCSCGVQANNGPFCSPFSKNCYDYFGNIGCAMDQLFILLTTANFPDVMLPAYHCFGWSPVFFVAYLVIGLYFMLNLVLAVSYSVFQGHTKDKVLDTVNKRVLTLDRVFDGVRESAHFGPTTWADKDAAAAASAMPLPRTGSVQLPPPAERDEESDDSDGGGDSDGGYAMAGHSRGRSSGRDGAGDGPAGGPSPWLVPPDMDSAGASAVSPAGSPSAAWAAGGRPSHRQRLAAGTATAAAAAASEDELQWPETFAGAAELAGKEGEMGWDTWRRLVHLLRPELSDVQAAVLFRTMDSRGVGSISKADFREISSFIEVRFGEKRTGRRTDYLCHSCSPQCVISARQATRAVAQNVWFRAFFDLLIYVNGFLIVIDFSLQADSTEDSVVSAVMQALLFAFALELAVKLFGLGFAEFCSDAFNLLDLLVVPAALIAEPIGLAMNDTTRVVEKIAFLRILRLLRALRALPNFGLLMRTFSSIVPMFARYMIVAVLVYYMFAILGMELFAGLIRPPGEDPGAVKMLEGTAYLANAYWDVTFDSLGRSYVTLFSLMVVNNWAITMEGYVAATSRWYMIYFYAWYFVIVILVLNIVTAFLLDDFTVMQAQIEDEENGMVPSWRHRLQRAARELRVPARKRWVLTRPKHPQQVYEMMFADDIEEHLRSMQTIDTGLLGAPGHDEIRVRAGEDGVRRRPGAAGADDQAAADRWAAAGVKREDSWLRSGSSGAMRRESSVETVGSEVPMAPLAAAAAAAGSRGEPDPSRQVPGAADAPAARSAYVLEALRRIVSRAPADGADTRPARSPELTPAEAEAEPLGPSTSHVEVLMRAKRASMHHGASAPEVEL